MFSKKKQTENKKKVSHVCSIQVKTKKSHMDTIAKTRKIFTNTAKRLQRNAPRKEVFVSKAKSRKELHFKRTPIVPAFCFFFSSSSAVPFPLSLHPHTHAQTTRGHPHVSLVSLWQPSNWGCAAASGSVLAIIRQREPLDQCPDPEHDDSKRPERRGPLEPRPTPEAGVEGQHHCREAQKRGTTHAALPRRPLDSRVARTLPQLCNQRPSCLLVVGLFLALSVLSPCAGAAHCARDWSSGGARRIERARKKEASKSGRSQAVQI